MKIMTDRNIRMLIAEDEPHTRDVLTHYIPWDQIGICEIYEAADGRAALEMAQTLKPDIILSDIRMPKMSGIELAHQLRKENQDCRFIFLSAYTDQEYLKSAIQIRAVSYVEKPINSSELCRAAETAVAEVLSQREYRSQICFHLQNKLCLAYASGNIGTLETEAAAANVALLCGPFLSASVRLYPSEALPWPEYEEEILLNYLKKHMGERCLFALKDPAHLVIHQETNESAETAADNLSALLMQIQEEIPRIFPQIHHVLSGIGSPTPDTAHLYCSYSQAVQARQRSFISSRPEIYSRKGTGSYSFCDACAENAVSAIRQGTYSDIQNALFCLRHRIRQYSDTSCELVKQYYIKLLLFIMRRSEDRHGTAFSELSASFVEALGQACCLDDLTEILLEATDCFFRRYPSSENTRIVDKAIDYILQNYSDEKLNIPFLASQLYLSSGYLSLLFKKETSKTINQFITEVRISHARDYLKDHTLSLNRIALLTGYHDANYFSKVFKRETGCTPKSFREGL